MEQKIIEQQDGKVVQTNRAYGGLKKGKKFHIYSHQTVRESHQEGLLKRGIHFMERTGKIPNNKGKSSKFEKEFFEIHRRIRNNKFNSTNKEEIDKLIEQFINIASKIIGGKRKYNLLLDFFEVRETEGVVHEEDKKALMMIKMIKENDPKIDFLKENYYKSLNKITRILQKEA